MYGRGWPLSWLYQDEKASHSPPCNILALRGNPVARGVRRVREMDVGTNRNHFVCLQCTDATHSETTPAWCSTCRRQGSRESRQQSSTFASGQAAAH